jgi:hypothetical protein
MRRVLPLTLALLPLLAPRVAAADEFDEPADTAVTGAVRAASWTPYVAVFYVAPPESKDAPEASAAPGAPPTVAPGLAEGWAALQRDAYIRRGDIAPGDPVVSGWRVDTTTANRGLGFQVHATETMRDPILTLPLGSDAHLRLELDILMQVSDEVKSKLVGERGLFEVLERSVTVHFVSDDPMNTRAKAEDEPMPQSARILEREAYPFRLPDLRRPAVPVTWPLRTPGVYEFRVKARIRGRLNEAERAETKDVEGAIRVAVGRSAVDVRKLTFEQTHRYRYYRRKSDAK